MSAPLWFSNGAFWCAQAALLILVGGFAPKLLRLIQPRVLLIYWRALFAAALLLPLIEPWRPLPAVANVTIQIGKPILAAAPAQPAHHWNFLHYEFVTFIVISGIIVRFSFLALGLFRLHQLRRASSLLTSLPDRASEIANQINARAEFRLSPDVDSPVTFGFFRPVILLPEHFPSMEPRFQLAIICHELLHVRRRDWAHHLLEEFFRAALWFHPAFAWLTSRIRLSREQVVDLEVLHLTGERKPYLDALLEISTGRALSAAIPAPPFLDERQLTERVALMLREVTMSKTRLIASLSVMIAALVLTGTLAAWAFPLKGAISLLHPQTATLTPDKLTIRPATGWDVHATITSNAKGPRIQATTAQSQPPAGTVTVRGASGPPYYHVHDGKLTSDPLPENLRRNMAEAARNLLQAAGAQTAPDLKPIKTVQPIYPRIARQAHVQGTVVLKMSVDKSGKVSELNYISGPAMLIQSAMEAARQWEFEPSASPATTIASFTFSTDDSSLENLKPVTSVRVASSTNADGTGELGKTSVSASNPDRVKIEPMYAPNKPFALEARKLGIVGSAFLTISVDENGNVTAAQVTKSLDPRLDKSAIETVLTWKLKGVRDGKPVSFQTPVELTFNLIH